MGCMIIEKGKEVGGGREDDDIYQERSDSESLATKENVPSACSAMQETKKGLGRK